MIEDDLKLYLPKYLSEENTKKLIDSIRSFPNYQNKSIYTNDLANDEIFQGDGVKNLPYFNLEKLAQREGNIILLSNTCDMMNYSRIYASSIVFAPILPLSKYIDFISKVFNKEKIENHLKAIKNQSITSIFYLPSHGSLTEDSIVFFDRLQYIISNSHNLQLIKDGKMFSLSDFGHYFFLFKLSIHFTRIQENVQRGSI